MTLEQLKMLRAVIQEGSIQAASHQLFKTQPAISKGLKQLETDLGITLLDRTGYKLKLTQQGEIIYQKVLILLEQNDQLNQIAKHFKAGYEAKVVIAVDAVFDLEKLVPIFEHIQQTFPHTQIILQQEFISGGIEAIINHKAELTISVTKIDFLNSFNLVSQHILTQSLVNVAAPKMLSRHTNLHTLAQLKDEYQIIVQDSGSLSKGVEFDVQHEQRKWYVNDFYSKRTLCISGIGWGRLPYAMVKEDIELGRLIALDLIDSNMKIELDCYVMKSKNKALGPVASLLWDKICLLSEQTGASKPLPHQEQAVADS